MTDETLPVVVDNEAQSRFEIHLDGELAVLEYSLTGDRLVLIHTEVPDAFEGRGVGGALVRTAIESAADRALTVVPRCRFARGWLERHPDVAATVTLEAA